MLRFLTTADFAPPLAQLDNFPVSDLGNVTATAILGWYAWHTASRTIPSLVKEFRDEMAAARAENRADREAFRGELAEERHCRHADIVAVLGALKELTDRIAQTNEKTD